MVSKDRKKQLIREILDGTKTQVEVARETDLSRQAISLWIKQYRKEGERSFQARRGRPKIKPLPKEIRERLGSVVRGQTPAEAGLHPSFDHWSYEAVRQLIIREAGVKLTYRFVARYLDEWGVPQPAPAPVKHPRTAVTTGKSPPQPVRESGNDDESFSLSDYETAIADARSKLRGDPSPSLPGKRTGRHARQRSAPTKKKKDRKRGNRGKRR